MSDPRLYDTSGYCDREQHTSCSGQLRAATGWHWFCACLCHPEPALKNPTHHPAVEAFHAARAALVAQSASVGEHDA